MKSRAKNETVGTGTKGATATVLVRMSAHNFERLVKVAGILGQTAEQLLNGELCGSLRDPEGMRDGELMAGMREPTAKEEAQFGELRALERVGTWKPQGIGKKAAGEPVPNVYMTPGNLARLQAVGAALECDPACLLNNFVCEQLATPSTMIAAMDFEAEVSTDEEAAEVNRRVTAAALPLDADGWNCDYFLPADGKAVNA